MFRAALGLAVLALLAGFFGFTGFAGLAFEGAELFFVVGIVLLVVGLIFGRR